MLAVQLVSKHSTARLAPFQPSHGLQKDRIHLVDAFIEANIGGPITLADMANVAALKPHPFCASIQESTGAAPINIFSMLVWRRRSGCCKPIYQSLRSPVGAVFSHQEHLTRIFGRLVGVTPGAYRRSVRY